MTVSISKQAFAILDRRDGTANGQIHLQDIASIDTDGKAGISDTEAAQAGLDPKLFKDDIQKLNQALKEFKDFDPTQVIFVSPTSISSKPPEKPTAIVTPQPTAHPEPPKQAPDPALFSAAETKELTGRYGLHETQSPINQGFTLLTEATGWKHENALYTLDAHAASIQATAKKYNINPQVLGAVLYDEIRHVKPTESVAIAMGKAKTFGLAQLGNPELVRQGYFDKDLSSLIKNGAYDQDIQRLKQAGKVPSNVQPRSLTPTQLRGYLNPDQVLGRFSQVLKDKGREYLLNASNNIDTLGGQLARIRKEQGISPADSLNTGSFQDEHQIARVVVFHNGRLDYAPKILAYMKIPELSQAIMGNYIGP
ncbi:MAG: hypothetical protein IV090_24240 [Candidatus Sericytochromatia bacterium]|nr:hypothetical protein [Candidatus Sericytochromatia bacterium]